MYEVPNQTALCIKCTKLIIKHVFLGDVLFLGVIFDLDKYIFPRQICFTWGSPQIRGILHLGIYGNWTGNSN
jgi:hypothetical protein